MAQCFGPRYIMIGGFLGEKKIQSAILAILRNKLSGNWCKEESLIEYVAEHLNVPMPRGNVQRKILDERVNKVRGVLVRKGKIKRNERKGTVVLVR